MKKAFRLLDMDENDDNNDDEIGAVLWSIIEEMPSGPEAVSIGI